MRVFSELIGIFRILKGFGLHPCVKTHHIIFTHFMICQSYLKSKQLLGGRGGWITRSRDRDQPGQHGETPSLLKIQKISWAWWHVPVIPATREAEAEELLELRRQAEVAVSRDRTIALQPG